MSPTESFDRLFSAFRDARGAYLRLREKGECRTDVELARDPDYRELYMKGLVIARLGGPDAVEAAIRSICSQSEARLDAVRNDLDRYWAGMGQSHVTH